MAKGRNMLSDKRPYKVFTALLMQSGTNAPTSIVLENTIGIVNTWTYQGPGDYYIDIPNTPQSSKVFFTATFPGAININSFNQPPVVQASYVESTSKFYIMITANKVASNNLIGNTSDYAMPIEIRVYN